MTPKEAQQMLDGFRRDAVSCTKFCTEGRVKERFRRKVACYSLAIKALDGVELLGDAVEQALDKYLAPNLATEIKNEITRILIEKNSRLTNSPERKEENQCQKSD